MVFMINSTLAPPILLAHTLVAKMSMTILFRAKLTLKSTPDAECAKVLSSTFYKRWHATQLNEVANHAKTTVAIHAAVGREKKRG